MEEYEGASNASSGRVGDKIAVVSSVLIISTALVSILRGLRTRSLSEDPNPNGTAEEELSAATRLAEEKHERAAVGRTVRQRLRSEARIRSGLTAFLTVMLFLMWSYVTLSDPLEGWSAPSSWFGALRASATDLLDSDSAMNFVLAIFAMNLTITVALVVQTQASGTVADEIAASAWRLQLDMVSLFGTVAGTTVAAIFWFVQADRSLIGVKILLTVVAVLSARLATSISRLQRNETERAIDFVDIGDQLEKISARQSEIPTVDVVTDSSGLLAKVKLMVTLYLLRAVALAVALVSVLILVSISLTMWNSHGIIRLLQSNWSNWLFLIAITTAVIVFCAVRDFQRWSDHRSDTSRWLTRWRFRAARMGSISFVGFVGGASVYVATGDLLLVAVTAIVFCTPPIVMWILINQSRSEVAVKWVRWLAEPVWRSVSLSLESRQDELVARRAVMESQWLDHASQSGR